MGGQSDRACIREGASQACDREVPGGEGFLSYASRVDAGEDRARRKKDICMNVS